MLHIRVDDEELNSNARFACGLGWPLPEGDQYLFESESHKAGAHFAFHPEKEPCPGCFPGGKPQFGIPLSHITRRQFDRLEAEHLEPDEPDYDPGPSLMDYYRSAWDSKFGPGGTHRRSQ